MQENSILKFYDTTIISRVFQRWLLQNYKTRERFVRVKWDFSQFSTSSPANSLPVCGTPLRQNKGTLGPKKKTSFNIFEIFLPSELVFTCDKLNKYAKKFRVVGTLIFANMKTALFPNTRVT